MTSVCSVEPPDQQLPSLPHRDEAPGAERRRETRAPLRQTQRHKGRIVPPSDPPDGHKHAALTAGADGVEMEPSETNSPDWRTSDGKEGRVGQLSTWSSKEAKNKLLSNINTVPTAAFSGNSSTFWDDRPTAV